MTLLWWREQENQDLILDEYSKGRRDGFSGRDCNPGGEAFSKFFVTIDLTTREFRECAYAYICGYLKGAEDRLAETPTWWLRGALSPDH